MAEYEMPDMVNKPPHYTSHPSGVECIQITEHMNFNLGSAFQYIWRADLKDDAFEDLEKAIWHIQREMERRKNFPPLVSPVPPWHEDETTRNALTEIAYPSTAEADALRETQSTDE